MKTRPIEPNIFETDPELHLIGGRARPSGRLVFPMPDDSGEYEPERLPAHGRLWSYTVQRIAPKSPPFRPFGPFEPFAVGYVELPGALIVESRLTDVTIDELHVGMPMELTTIPLYSDTDGTSVLMFAFRPQGKSPS